MGSKFIPYSTQNIIDEDIESVVSVLRSGWLTQGDVGRKFEAHLADYCRVTHAVSFNSATSALHACCLALGIGPGDKVYTVSNTFVASANCVLMCGASVDFIDIDSETFNISIESLEQRLIEDEKKRELPKAVIAVHFAGLSCNMQEISRLSAKFGFFTIEDASHALGGKYLGFPVGACEFSDLTVFSFHPVKPITTGEGGCVTTKDSSRALLLKAIRSHGITERSSDNWKYKQTLLGFNYRLSDINAALGLSQLKRLDEFIDKRSEAAQFYIDSLNGIPLKFQKIDSSSKSSWHLFVVIFSLEEVRNKVYKALRLNNFGVNVHYIPVHTQPFYNQMGFYDGYCLNAEEYYSKALSIPLFVDISKDSQTEIINIIKDSLNK